MATAANNMTNLDSLSISKAMMMYNGGTVQDPAIHQTNRLFKEEEEKNVDDPNEEDTGDQATAPGMDEQLSPMSIAIAAAIFGAFGLGAPITLGRAFAFFTEQQEPDLDVISMAPIDTKTMTMDEIDLTDEEMSSSGGHFSEQGAANAPGAGAEGEMSISNEAAGGEGPGAASHGEPGAGAGPDSEAVGDPDSDSGEDTGGSDADVGDDPGGADGPG